MADGVIQGCKVGPPVGFQMAVRWIRCGEMGPAADGSDSYLVEVGRALHSPDNKSVNPATPAANKMVCSTAGIQAIV